MTTIHLINDSDPIMDINSPVYVLLPSIEHFNKEQLKELREIISYMIRHSKTENKKRGRPRKYTDSVEAHTFHIEQMKNWRLKQSTLANKIKCTAHEIQTINLE